MQADRDAEPLDLSFSGLRGVSPLHLEYMRNMGTPASLSFSLMRGNRLWGLVSCHHAAPRRPSLATRSLCGLISQMLAARLTAREEAAQGTERARLYEISAKLVARMAEAPARFAESLVSLPDDLCALTGAAGAAVLVDGNCTLVGRTPAEPAVRRIAGWLAELGLEDVHATATLPAALPEASALSETACGLLAIRISRLHPSFVLWFRPELVHTITWGGAPDKAPNPGTGRLDPRLSFDAWRQMVRLQAAPWSTPEVTAARELRLAIISIVFRQAEVRANLVDALAQPLSGAVAFLHGCDLMVRSGDDYGKQDLLEGLHRGIDALGRASAILHNLRGFLHKDVARQRRLDINAAVRNAVQIGAAGFERQGKGRITLDLAPALPQVIADGKQIEQAIANLVRNAVEAMGQGGVAVRELRIATALVEGGIEVLVADTGPGLPPEIAQAPFRFFATTKPNGLGLGLSISHSIIESHGGVLRFETNAGGTRFRIVLPAEPEPDHKPGLDTA